MRNYLFNGNLHIGFIGLRYSMLVLVLLVFITLLSGCTSGPAGPAVRPLSEVELNQFVRKNNTVPIEVEHAAYSTIALYQTNNGLGYYQLSVNEKGQIFTWESAFSGGGVGTDQLSLEYHGTDDPYQASFAFINIVDRSILARAYRADVLFNRESKVSKLFNGKPALIFINLTDNKIDAEVAVTVYDKNNNVIYSRN